MKIIANVYYGDSYEIFDWDAKEKKKAHTHIYISS